MKRLDYIISCCTALFLILISSTPAFSQNPPGSGDGIHSIAFLMDDTKQLTLDEITAPAAENRFQAAQSSDFSFGTALGAVWLRFVVPAPLSGNTQDNRLLIINKAFFSIDLFLPNQDSDELSYTRIRTGTFHGHKGQAFTYCYPVFSLPGTRYSDQTIYLRIDPSSPVYHASLNFSVTISDTADFIKTSWKELGFYGIIIGIMAAMILYNLFLWLVLMDRVIFLYVAYILCFLSYMFVRTNLIAVLGCLISGLPVLPW